jgi:hypothetical protein
VADQPTAGNLRLAVMQAPSFRLPRLAPNALILLRQPRRARAVWREASAPMPRDVDFRLTDRPDGERFILNKVFNNARTSAEEVERVDAFKDRLSQRARDTSRPALAHQCQGRAIEAGEAGLAEALMEIYRSGTHDYAAVAAQLAAKGVVAPKSGRTDWTEALLAEELAAINAELDAAYAEHGYGA